MDYSQWTLHKLVAASAILALLAFGCHREAKEAEALVARNQISDAERLLTDTLRSRPQDPDLRIALGHVYLLEHRTDDADSLLMPLADVPKYAQRVAQQYRDAAQKIATASPAGRADSLGRVGRTAAKLDPAISGEMCTLLVGQLKPDDYATRSIAKEAAKIDNECRRKVLQTVSSWVTSAAADTRSELLAQDCILMGEIDVDARADCARAMRTLAQKAAATDRLQAARVLDAAMQVSPEIKEELESVVLHSSLTEVSAPVLGQMRTVLPGYSGSALDVTKKTMREIGIALDSYATMNRRYPNARSFQQMWGLIASYITAPVSQTDAWGAEFQYAYADGAARLISGGADSHVESSSLAFGPARGVVDDYGTDIIWENGQFVQEPTENAIHKYDRGVPTSRP